VAHNNGVPDDNRAENLRWATRKENHADIQKHGTHIKGERNGRAKLTEEMVIAARKAHKHGATVSELARYYGMSHSGMLSAVRAGNWSHVN